MPKGILFHGFILNNKDIIYQVRRSRKDPCIVRTATSPSSRFLLGPSLYLIESALKHCFTCTSSAFLARRSSYLPECPIPRYVNGCTGAIQNAVHHLSLPRGCYCTVSLPVYSKIDYLERRKSIRQQSEKVWTSLDKKEVQLTQKDH